ncbi:transposase [Streptomyces sp. NPDC050164]|uniref:transposase n=1 Tax=Streptomyces sp. NPDC050164 TaxID=3365605 RepID=UPI0037A1CA83
MPAPVGRRRVRAHEDAPDDGRGRHDPLRDGLEVVRKVPSSARKAGPAGAESPAAEPEPVQFRLSNLPADTPLATLVRTPKLRWRIEHDYREMKQALGLAHFEGRTWRGRHHHVSLVSVAHAFCTLQRIIRSPKGTASA